jgi:transposase-like protein
MKRTWAGEVRNVSLLVAIGVNAEGFREIPGLCEGAKEDKSGWSAFLRHLVDRGLRGVGLIISDACRGLVESVAEYLPDARWQRCVVGLLKKSLPSIGFRPWRMEDVRGPSRPDVAGFPFRREFARVGQR